MSNSQPDFCIRTITAGIELESVGKLQPFDHASRFLTSAREAFEEAGFVVQGTRIATQPLNAVYSSRKHDEALRVFRELDSAIAEAGHLLSVGPLIEDDRDDPEFSGWASELVATAPHTFFSVAVASAELDVHHRSVRVAADTMRAISKVDTNGEANLRFAAAARIPASTPFFPVAHHAGPAAFAIGLESASLVGTAFAGTSGFDDATAALSSLLESRLAPALVVAEELAEKTSWIFRGFDLSPAPSLEASIAGPIEGLTGQPFGAPSTLAACAAITRGLDAVNLPTCGYSGLMLPLLEDRVLARRAAEGRFGIRELLLYSSVCGTGLDVIPLPGDVGVDELAGLILDLAALSSRLGKPLAARLLPIPGKQAGDPVAFDNPHLTDAVVLPLA